ncbi:hypothetical protein AYO27_24430 [Rhizobium sp. GHKF11]|nr:hypothetical protein AYO27_24430 [Rhizobium sp. GHKF11]
MEVNHTTIFQKIQNLFIVKCAVITYLIDSTRWVVFQWIKTVQTHDLSQRAWSVTKSALRKDVDIMT